MYIVETYSTAVILTFITMLCWGSWANTQKLTKGYRFELFYWDYVLGILLFSLLIGFTLGSHGEKGTGFMESIKQASLSSVINAVFGGIIFNLSNILLVAAIAIAGMSIAFPVGIGLCMVLGVIVNYIATPQGDAFFLFMGIGFVTLAIVTDAMAYRKLAVSNKTTPVKGIVLSILAGFLMAWFFRFVASSIAFNPAMPELGKLTPYTAFFFFVIGIVLSNFIFNTYLMQRPLAGVPVTSRDYFKADAKSHLSGIIGGMIWATGTMLSLLAASKAGYAISFGLGQGATLIGALWGVFIWKEFKHAPKGTNPLLALMFLLFIIGLGLVIYAGSIGGASRKETTEVGYRTEDYKFDTIISRQVLENYLDRSITIQNLLIGKGNFEDNLRMITNIGAKFIGRSACQWGKERSLLSHLQKEKELASRVHAIDKDIILQACIFEIVTPEVNEVPVPEWAFAALGMPAERRNFRYDGMIYADGQFKNQWGNGSVPDVSRPETKLWFYFLAVSYINAGIEAIHFGQLELMNKNDQHLDHYAQILSLIRSYATQHARRHMVICDAHVPSGGFLHQGKLLLDFHSFPLRVKEVNGRPQEAVLEKGYLDALYGRSKGGMTYSGWTCDHLPYLVELDNWGASNHPGKENPGNSLVIWVWGYDEITWFAHQSKAYRHDWLRYAWKWLRDTDINGHFEMPGGRTCESKDPNEKFWWYYANNPSEAFPEGFGDEDVIKAIWNGNFEK